VYIRRKQKGNLSMENIDIIYQRTIYREKAKGINFTLDDLYKSPIEHQQVLSIVFLVALVISCVSGLIGNILVSYIRKADFFFIFTT
jgi:hypothetical protein